MDKELNQLFESEAALQRHVADASIDFDHAILVARESVADMLILNDAIDKKIRILVTDEEILDTVVQRTTQGLVHEESDQRVIDVVLGADSLSAAVGLSASGEMEEEHIEVLLAGMLNHVDSAEQDPEPWIESARQLIPGMSILGNDDTPLDEVTQSLRDRHVEAEAQDLISTVIRNDINQAVETVLSIAAPGEHDNLGNESFALRLLVSGVIHGGRSVADQLQGLGIDRQEPVIPGSEFTREDVALLALAMLNKKKTS